MEEIYAEALVVNQGLGVGWVGRRSPGRGGASAVTAPGAIACKTDDNDMVLSLTYSAEMGAVAQVVIQAYWDLLGLLLASMLESHQAQFTAQNDH